MNGDDLHREKMIQFLRTLMTFGGPKDAPTDVDASFMPNSPLEMGYSARFGGSPDSQDQPDLGQELRAKQLRKKFLMRQFSK
jgi:hypothetical protein